MLVTELKNCKIYFVEVTLREFTKMCGVEY